MALLSDLGKWFSREVPSQIIRQKQAVQTAPKPSFMERVSQVIGTYNQSAALTPFTPQIPVQKIQSAGIGAGKLLQKTPIYQPKFTIINKQTGKPMTINQPISPFMGAYNFGAGIVRDYGKTIERVSNPILRKTIVPSIKRGGSELKKGHVLTALSEPGVQDILNVSDFVPFGAVAGIVGKGAKGITAGKNILKAQKAVDAAADVTKVGKNFKIKPPGHYGAEYQKKIISGEIPTGERATQIKELTKFKEELLTQQNELQANIKNYDLIKKVRKNIVSKSELMSQLKEVGRDIKNVTTQLKEVNAPKPKVEIPVPSDTELGLQALQRGRAARKTTEIPQSVSGEIGGNVPKVFAKIKNAVPQVGDDFQDWIIQKVKTLGEARKGQEALYKIERAQRLGKSSSIGKSTSGEAGALSELGAMKGEMEKFQFEPLKEVINQETVDKLFDIGKGLNQGERLTYINGVLKMLGGKIPTESELVVMSKKLKPELITALLDKKPFWGKVMGGILNLINVPRAIMSTLDLSAPGRQGIVLIGSKEYWKAFGSQFKYAVSEDAYKGLLDQMASHQNWDLATRSKLAITDMSPILSQREEAFMSNLVERVPIFGELAKASNRAYSGFLNKLRFDTFNRLLKGAVENGENAEVVADDIAKFVNAATGRGNLGKNISRLGPLLNATFFSPRLMASRINLLNPKFYANLNPYVRQEALTSVLTFLGTGITALSLAKMGGADVELNPRSADFAKIKVGNTRYEVFGGFTPYVRLVAQEVLGETKSSTTGKITKLGKDYGAPTRGDMLVRFMQSKEAPVISLANALISGKTWLGGPVNVPAEIINRTIPMVVQDIYDIAKDKNSIAAGVLMGIPAIFGVGVQTYGKEVPNIKISDAGKTSVKLSPVGGVGEDIVNKITNTPESNVPESQRQAVLEQAQEQRQRKVEMEQLKASVKEGNKTPDIEGINVQEELKKMEDKQVKSEAKAAVGKDKKSRVVGSTVYYYDSTTNKVSSKSLIDYEKSEVGAKYLLASDRFKRAGDIKSWIGITEQYIDYLKKFQSSLTSDVEEAQRLTIQNKIEDLETSLNKYKGYGGFSKGKKGKKVSFVKISAPKMKSRAIKISTPNLTKIKLPEKPKFTKIVPKKTNPLTKAEKKINIDFTDIKVK